MTQAMHRILLIEDDAEIRNVVRAMLESRGYRIVEAGTAARAEIEARSHKPDLLLVDLGLPDADGLSVIRKVRAWSTVPIVVLSARTQEEQKIAALDAGADDYVTKPFSAPELLARVRAGLRRNIRTPELPPVLAFDQMQVDLGRRETRGPQGRIQLTPLEYRVLECLSKHMGMIVRQNELILQVWGPDRIGDTRNLRVCIKNLRNKLEPDPRKPKYLVTEPGLGYRLRIDIHENVD
jgi:two-component system KDP operon response regulator KdpE